MKFPACRESYPIYKCIKLNTALEATDSRIFRMKVMVMWKYGSFYLDVHKYLSVIGLTSDILLRIARAVPWHCGNLAVPSRCLNSSTYKSFVPSLESWLVAIRGREHIDLRQCCVHIKIVGVVIPTNRGKKISHQFAVPLSVIFKILFSF